jgi:signal transduction histidine kinase
MNLFWKIFITFGVAMTLTLVGAVFVSFRLAGLAFDQLNIENREMIVERAAAELAEGGEEQLRAWLSRNPSPTPGIVLMIIDGSGKDLLDRPLPQRFEMLLNSPSLRPPSAPRNFRPPQFTASLVAADGSEYRLLFVRTRVTVLGVLTWPATQVAVLTISILAAAATSLLLARYLSSPIVRLQRASRALAAGALETRVGGPFNRRKDEVGTLARDFDTMAERVQALVDDKDTLLRDVSHELRSPLARIRMGIAMLNPDATPQLRAELEHNIAELDALIDEILLASRLDTVSDTEAREDIDLLALLAEECARVEATLEGAPVTVHGDRRLLRRLMRNLLENARRHGGGSPIEVGLRELADERVELRVCDRGPGVPETERARIFEPFYRPAGGRVREGSVGLGLSLVRQIAQHHGGDASYLARAGGGACLRVELSKRPAKTT